MDFDISWIYLAIFLIIPLARILPRFIARQRQKAVGSSRVQDDAVQQADADSQDDRTPQTGPMRVLGELNRGCRTFGALQKVTGMDAGELERYLEELEQDGLMHVRQKRGLFGIKIELYPTDKGFKKFYS